MIRSRESTPDASPSSSSAELTPVHVRSSRRLQRLEIQHGLLPERQMTRAQTAPNVAVLAPAHLVVNLPCDKLYQVGVNMQIDEIFRTKWQSAKQPFYETLQMHQLLTRMLRFLPCGQPTGMRFRVTAMPKRQRKICPITSLKLVEALSHVIKESCEYSRQIAYPMMPELRQRLMFIFFNYSMRAALWTFVNAIPFLAW